MNWVKNNQFIALLIGVIFSCSLAFIGTNIEVKEYYNEVYINDGDTLWTLSDQYRGKTPKHEWISEVMVANRLETQMIQAGETLKVPGALYQYAPDKGVELAVDSE
jgi:hypothetical protein